MPHAAAYDGGRPTDAWWARHCAERTEVMSSWRFASRDDFEAVLRLEFPQHADAWLAAHPGALGLSYGYVLFTVRKAAGMSTDSRMDRCSISPRTISTAVEMIEPSAAG